MPGYGPRDPHADDASVQHWRHARLRARLEFVVGALLIGLYVPLLVWHIASSATFEMLPLELFDYCLLVPAGLACLCIGIWFGTYPVLTWDDHGIEMRHRPWRAAIRVMPGEVVWRPESRYVGRYLFAHPAGRPRVRFPLWMIRRGGARRLFAYLDRSYVSPR